MTPHDSAARSGLTLRSVSAGILGLVFMGWVITTASSMIGFWRTAGMDALAVPALAVMLFIVLLNGAARMLNGWQLLSRPELLCVTYMLMIGAPIMSVGFWVSAFAIPTGPLKAGRWEAFDATPEKLRPGGPELLGASFDEGSWSARGGEFEFETVQYGRGKEGVGLTLTNTSAGRALVEREMRLVQDGLHRNASYLFAALVRVRSDDPNVSWMIEFVPDAEGGIPLELVRGRGPTKPSYLFPGGFDRRGNFAFSIPRESKEVVRLRVELSGPGTIELVDVRLNDITAIAGAMSGLPVISEAEYAQLDEADRAGFLVRPDNMVSLAGLRYLIGGTALWRQWSGPMVTWCLFLLLLSGALFGVAAIMRRQWIDRERFPLPLAYPVQDLIGHPRETGETRLPAVFRNMWFWTGFGLGAFYCGMQVARGFYPAVPNLIPSISLATYLRGPVWGGAWDQVNFSFNVFVFAIGLLLELNVLISLVLGFFLFRSQHVVGQQTGWSTYADFPFGQSQSYGGFLFYGLTVLALARKHIVETLRQAARGLTAGGEPLSYRSAYGIFFGCVAGLFLWSLWIGTSVTAAVVFPFVMLVVAVVLMKLRAECGPPGFAWFGQGGVGGFLLPAITGLAVLGPMGFGLANATRTMLAGTTLLLVGGIILEFVEISRRYGVRRFHPPVMIVIGVLGAVLVGGWFTLTGAYSTGTENLRHSSQFTVDPGGTTFIGAHLDATNEMSPDAPPAKVKPDRVAFYLSGAGAVVLTVLRQIFAGFWFHPVGWLLGPSLLMRSIWGSLLMAWIVRLVVLRLTGASTVREKLRPFAVGMIASVVVVYLAAFLINYFVWSTSPGKPLFEGSLAPGF